MFEAECRNLGEEIAGELATSSADATDFGKGPFPLHIAQLSEVHTAKLRASNISVEMEVLQEQLAVIALLNDGVDASEVVADVTAQMSSLTDELSRRVKAEN